MHFFVVHCYASSDSFLWSHFERVRADCLDVFQFVTTCLSVVVLEVLLYYTFSFIW